jgi:hypothetical protein
MSPSSNEFRAFLIKLSKDVSARNEYQADPIGTMKAAGLSETQIIAVLSQDPTRIQRELGGGADEIKVRVTIIISVEA